MAKLFSPLPRPRPRPALTYSQTLAVDLVGPARVVPQGFDAAFQVHEEGLQERLPGVQGLQGLGFITNTHIFSQICCLQQFSKIRMHIFVVNLLYIYLFWWGFFSDVLHSFFFFVKAKADDDIIVDQTRVKAKKNDRFEVYLLIIKYILLHFILDFILIERGLVTVNLELYI